jgi:hypothetical protein
LGSHPLASQNKKGILKFILIYVNIAPGLVITNLLQDVAFTKEENKNDKELNDFH